MADSSGKTLKIYKSQINMSHLFSFKTITFLLFAVMLAELLMLGRIYSETHSETVRDARLVEQILQEQMQHLEARIADTAEYDYQRAFALEKLSKLKNLNISFVDGEGRVLDSNQPNFASQSWWSSFMTWLVDKHLGLMSVITPVFIAEQHVGDLIISNNLGNELTEVTTQAVEILLPWLFLFLLSSLLLVKLFSFLLDGIEPLLSTQTAEVQQERSFALQALVNPRHLPVRLMAAVGALNRLFDQQKRQLITAQETERKRLAAELHDELGQHLTAVRMELDKLSQDEYSAAKPSIKALRQHSERLAEIVRSNLEQLNPPELTEQGLRYCLQKLIDDWQWRHPQHQIDFSLSCHPRLLDPQSQLIAYRIIQECLTNISRHAGEKITVVVSLYREADKVVIEVRDNGRGCDLDAEQSGFGLPGMKQRVEALSGEFKMMSQPMQGMQILAALPVGGKQ